MLSDSDLAAMRTMAEGAMPDVATLMISSGSYTGGKPVFVNSGSCVCRIAPRGNMPTENVEVDQVIGTEFFNVTLPAGTALNAKDKILIGGYTFEVVGVETRSIETARRVVCVRM